ncbi:hypothetical protein CANARDRAFT_5964 [[Candida] arabinofermentans NRRL YB-2248]|uniref:RGS domain-containing protein n=1 Tax=[Candida] arabinofermentans NRRL YB-2248 TaxID=983967 RepID=A0A1E4T6U5_9ASCO|nr:hypothetical protein CANARDRAFT_5964 [[Candida] arabinofermentans NRRL YB-2248]
MGSIADEHRHLANHHHHHNDSKKTSSEPPQYHHLIQKANQGYIVPTLEELIRSCYSQSLGENPLPISHFSYSNTPDQHYFSATNFKDYIIKSHCYENLQFLIDVHEYECLWNLVFDETSGSPNRSRMPTSDTPLNKHTLPNSKMKQNISSNNDRNMSRGSVSDKKMTKRDSVSLDSENENVTVGSKKHRNSTQSVKDPSIAQSSEALTADICNLTNLESFVDINQYNREKPICSADNEKQLMDNMFNNYSINKQLNSEREKGVLSQVEPPQSFVELREKLVQVWNKIINNYIKEDSLDQINLPNSVTKLILEEDSRSSDFHHPNTLLKAKKSIYLLLQENVYRGFIELVEARLEKDKRNSMDQQSSIPVPPVLSKGPCGIINPEVVLCQTSDSPPLEISTLPSIVSKGPCSVPNPEVSRSQFEWGSTPCERNSNTINSHHEHSLLASHSLPFHIHSHWKSDADPKCTNIASSSSSQQSPTLNNTNHDNKKSTSLFRHVGGMRPLRSRFKKKNSSQPSNGLFRFKSNTSSNGSQGRRYSSSSSTGSTCSLVSQPDSPHLTAAVDKSQQQLAKLSLMDTISPGNGGTHHPVYEHSNLKMHTVLGDFLTGTNDTINEE